MAFGTNRKHISCIVSNIVCGMVGNPDQRISYQMGALLMYISLNRTCDEGF